MHTHTSPCSKCASMMPQELIKSLHCGGYQGCVITNHFYHGNCGIDRSLPWNEFVKKYENDYLECKTIAKKYDLDVIFGIEEHLKDGLEILCYGITPQFLYDNPQLIDSDLKTWYMAVDSFGALCIQAHPYRNRDYITNPRVLPLEFIHGVEVYNHCNMPEENLFAEKFCATHHELIITSGADAHSPNIVCCAGIETDERITDEKSLAMVLKSGNYSIIK